MNATASYHSSPLPGSFVYTPASGEVLAAGPHTLHVDFTPDDPDDYESASKDVSLTVNTKPLTITANDQSKTYGAAFTFAGTEFAPVGLTNGDTIATVTLTSAGAAATATVTAPGPTYPIAPSAAVFGTGNASNYSISYVDGTLTVNPRPATVAADPKSKIYGDDNPTLTATVTGTVNGDVLNYTLATTALKFAPVGSYPITVTLGSNPNYTVTPTDSTLTVNARPATVAADAKSKPYGDDNPALTATVVGTVNGDVLNYTLATTALKFSPVGSYPITVTLGSNPNYTVTPTDGTLTVNARPATVAADAKRKTVRRRQSGVDSNRDRDSATATC